MKTRYKPLLPKLIRAAAGCFLGVILFVILLALLQASSNTSPPAAAARGGSGRFARPQKENRQAISGDYSQTLVANDGNGLHRYVGGVHQCGQGIRRGPS